MRTNFHTHHVLCRHAIGHVDDYVKEAISKNVKILGFSDHAPIHNALFQRMTKDEFLNIYLKEIETAKEQYKGRIKIYSGLEAEYFYDFSEYSYYLEKVDYLILGTHFYTGKRDHLESSYNIDTREKLKEYTDLMIAGIYTGYFRILAHPDLFMVSYPMFDEYCEECSRRIIEAAIKMNMYIEYNANGKRRGKRLFSDGTIGYSYPNEHFFKIVKEYSDAKVILSSDCHQPSDLYDQAMIEALSDLDKIGLCPVHSIFEEEL